MIAPIIEGEDVSIVSKNGDVNITGAIEEHRQQLECSESSFGGFTGSIGWDGISVGTKTDITRKTESRLDTNIVSPILQARKSLTMRAKGDLNAEAAIIDGNDIDLEAEEGELNIEAMQEQHEINNSHEMLTTTVKYRVGNSYTDTVNASIATAKNIKQAKKALEHLNEMREQFEQGRVSRRALRNAEENFAIISANVGMSALQITKAVSNAAGTTLVGGMYATVDVETSGSRETMELQKTTNIKGSITGNKIRIKSGKDAKIQSSISSDTSTEIKVKFSGQTTRLSKDIDAYKQNMIVPMVTKVADLSANMRSGTIRLLVEVFGNKTTEDITDNVRWGNYKYKYTDSSGLQKKLQNNEKMMQILTPVWNDPTVTLNKKEIVKTALENADFTNPDKFFADTQEQQAVRQNLTMPASQAHQENIADNPAQNQPIPEFS